MFKLSLKEVYDPAHVNEDFLIEDILQRAFVDGVLEEQASKLPIDYIELSTRKIAVPLPKTKKKG